MSTGGCSRPNLGHLEDVRAVVGAKVHGVVTVAAEEDVCPESHALALETGELNGLRCSDALANVADCHAWRDTAAEDAREEHQAATEVLAETSVGGTLPFRWRRAEAP